MLRDDIDIIYEKAQYIVWKANNGYVVYNTNKVFKKGHTHLRSYKRVKEVIDYMLELKFPLHYSNYFLVSMKRLSDDKVFSQRLEDIHQTRLSKGRKMNYRNINNGRR